MRNPTAIARCIGLLVAATMAPALVSCGSAYRGEPLAGAFEPEDPEQRVGREVFFTHCHECHPGGAGGLGFSLNDKYLPGWLIRFQVRRGMGAMPAFPEEQIGAEALDALVAYLQALRGHGG